MKLLLAIDACYARKHNICGHSKPPVVGDVFYVTDTKPPRRKTRVKLLDIKPHTGGGLIYFTISVPDTRKDTQ